MKKILRVGDPHVQISNMSDSQKLIDFVLKTAIEKKIKTIEFLGDLFHTHAILRSEIVHFWKNTFEKIDSEKIQCIVLVGNHDQHPSKEKQQIINALNVFEATNKTNNHRIIVNKPMIIDNIAYIPHTSDHNKFIQDSCDLFEKGAQKLLVAHQTFTGARYDNGFYAQDGIEIDLVSQESIISGHIHTRQQIGKCDYPGTAKWDTISDSNLEKGIWVYDHDDLGAVMGKEFISTYDVVKPINKITLREGEKEPKLDLNARNYLELIGKTSWITKIKKKYKGNVHIKARPTDRKSIVHLNGEIESIKDFLFVKFDVIDGIKKESIQSFLEELENE